MNRILAALRNMGISIADDASIDEIRSAAIQNGLYQDGHYKIPLQVLMDVSSNSMLDEDKEIISYRIENPPLAGNDFEGIVSFKAECLADIDRLKKALAKHSSNNFDFLKIDPKQEGSDFGVEMRIRKPLSIKGLRDLLDSIIDCHRMTETLRALPLSENSLENFGNTVDVYDWAGKTEGQLFGFPDD